MEKHFCPYCMTPVKEGEPCAACGLTSGTYSPSPHHLPPGTILVDRYLVGRVLGEGGFGITYIGCDLRLELKVAIKEYFPSDKVTRHAQASLEVSNYTGALAGNYEQGKEKYLQEARTMARMNKQGEIVSVRDFFEANNTAYIVMEYVEGQNLKEYLVLHRQISEKQIYNWGLQLGEFLKQLHSRNPKVLYRDLKPENIMVQPDKSLRLVDVGAALRLKEERMYQRKRVGTFGYAAPEQWDGKAVDERADIYGLGAVLYMIMEGEENLKNRTGAEHVMTEKSGMPEGMVRAVRRCLRRDKGKRYATAEAFLADWKRYKSAGKGKALAMQAEKMLKYFFLYAAVYMIWYRAGALTFAGQFIAGYLWLKTAEWIFHKYNERWEQKKSVWCRGVEW